MSDTGMDGGGRYWETERWGRKAGTALQKKMDLLGKVKRDSSQERSD